MILKLGKGQEIALINKTDYYRSLKRLFDYLDRKKFQVLDHNPTFTNLATIHNYNQTIYKHGEISETEMKEMIPKAAQVAHILLETHKKYKDLPSFRPIIDTTNTPHYGVGTFFTYFLNPFTQNVHSIKDSFEAVDCILSTPTELFDEGYRYFSFDVTSLFIFFIY